MKKTAILTALIVGIVTAAVSYAAPQQDSSTPSLAELARQLKAQRAKESTKAVKTYTNEDMPKSTGLSTSEDSADSAKADSGEGSEAAAPAEAKPKSGVHDEKYYREQMAELRAQKEMHQRELTVLEQKLSQNQMQYYPDPNKTLNQESNPATFRSDINKKTDEIAQKKKQIEADDKAITDLEQQCQREGCPAGWLR